MKNNKKIMLVMAVLLCTCISVFASAKAENAKNYVEVSGKSWAGFINGIEVTLQYNEGLNIIEGELVNRTHRDLDDINLEILANDVRKARISVGIDGELDDDESYPIFIELNEKLDAWTILIDASNVPRYGVSAVPALFEVDTLKNLNGYSTEINGLMVDCSYDSDDEVYTVTAHNYKNTDCKVTMNIYLNNGEVVSIINNVRFDGYEAQSFDFDFSDSTGFGSFVPEVICTR